MLAMLNDDIITEVRERREEYAAFLSYDLKRIVSDLKSEEAKSDRRVLVLPSKKPTLARRGSSV